MHYLPFLLASAGLCIAAESPAQNSTSSGGAAGSNCNIVSTHTVIAGDNLANIATASNVTLTQLQFVNTQIANPRSINVGDVINIPNSACVAPTTAPSVEPTATCVNASATGLGSNGTTRVVAGDTFIVIAKQKLGITLSALVAANPQIKDINKISVGDVINIPLCGATTSSATGCATGTAGGNGTTSAGLAKTTASKGAKKEKFEVDGAGTRRVRGLRGVRLERRDGVTFGDGGGSWS